MKRLLIAAPLLLGLLAGCDVDAQTATTKAVQQEAATTSNNHAAMIARCQDSLLTSQELSNLCSRAKRINVQNMQSCISLFTQNGALVAFYPVKGKVSSLNSYLLAGDRLATTRDLDPDSWKVLGASSQNAGAVLEAPDIDGAYGKNADGIFFFTADTDSYVEWQGDYLWSDQCLTPSVAPMLVRPVTSK